MVVITRSMTCKPGSFEAMIHPLPEIVHLILQHHIYGSRCWHADTMAPGSVCCTWLEAARRVRRELDCWETKELDIDGKALLSHGRTTLLPFAPSLALVDYQPVERRFSLGPYDWRFSIQLTHVYLRVKLEVPEEASLPARWARRTELEVILQSRKNPARMRHLFTRHLFAADDDSAPAAAMPEFEWSWEVVRRSCVQLVDYGSVLSRPLDASSDADDEAGDGFELDEALAAAGLRVVVRLRVHPGARERECTKSHVLHALALHERLHDQWANGYRVYCDLCERDVDQTGESSEFTRFMRRCSRGCNFDVCHECIQVHGERLGLQLAS